MRFLVDECVSPSLARYLNGLGYDAIHPRDRGWLGQTDRTIFSHAVEDDRIVVTENGGDFRHLATEVDIHPGLIVLPSVAKAEAQRLMTMVIAWILDRGDARPGDLLVDAVLSVDRTGRVDVEPLP